MLQELDSASLQRTADLFSTSVFSSISNSSSLDYVIPSAYVEERQFFASNSPELSHKKLKSKPILKAPIERLIPQRKKVSFNERADYYIFERTFGLDKVPSQGLPLGMTMNHHEVESRPLSEVAGRRGDFLLDFFQRKNIFEPYVPWLLSESGKECREALFDIEKVRKFRTELPICSCQSRGGCARSSSCYCSFNGIECHEWCVCRKSCLTAPTSVVLGPVSEPVLQCKAINAVVPDTPAPISQSLVLGKSVTIVPDVSVRKSANWPLSAAIFVHFLILLWLLYNAFNTMKNHFYGQVEVEL
eukprot:TRINITY_DN4368_c0_g1_i1.p1 TRINITY_DN4368_c0_g1~~TRINITY_DN4368_c0_g1_i1.p1  ORF type:complete len:302 (+),score=57.05 TRINITY_DN4368_c0_g1_i1:227-1132(+)